jgi:undecaprenyl-diphosphatase
MSFVNVLILAIVQGLAELLPVSSSAHVVVAEKLLGLDPSSPPMTLLLVMLHTGTMVAVIVYFWREWLSTYFQSIAAFRRFAGQIIIATLLTAIVGGGLTLLIQRTLLASLPRAEIEDLFGHLELIAPALGTAGVLILVAGILMRRRAPGTEVGDLSTGQSATIGAVQGLCLPFRGLSRSGTTISTGLLFGVSRRRVEAFSFALAVVLTPPAVVRECWRLVRGNALAGTTNVYSTVIFSVLGAAIAFIAGLTALKWLSRWLETDRWYLFGIYCLGAAILVGYLHIAGY